MKIVAKIFLAAFLITLAVSLTGPGSEFLGGILKPAATVFFMLFVILLIFGNEIARYDEEQGGEARGKRQKSNSSAPSQDRTDPLESSREKQALTSTHRP